VLVLLVFLPLLVFAGIRLSRGDDARTAVVRAALAWAVIAILGAEGLGAFGMLTRRNIVVFWLVVVVSSSIAAPRWPVALRNAWSRRRAWRPAPLELASIGVFLAATLVIALVAAPNNWDSLTYHLTRVEQWIQNGTLAHFPTNIEQQVSLNPGAEILILHARVVSGSDVFSNVVQWLAAGIGAVASTLAAAHLGAGRRGQTAAAVFVLTVPMVVLQASSTQNDLVTACWVIVFAERVLALRAAPSAWRAMEAGMALGLALVTKGTALMAVLPASMGLAAVLLAFRDRRTITFGLAAGVMTLALNAGWWVRNYQAFGTPVGTIGSVVGNREHGLGVTYANAIRNLASQVMTPSVGVNRAVHAGATALVRAAGLDPEHPASTMNTFAAARDVSGLARLAHEDLAANPLHTVVAIAALGWALLRRRPMATAVFAGGVVCAAVLYCAVLRWQIWGARLQVPLFLLAAPIVGCWIDRWRAVPAQALAAVMALSGTPALLFNMTRPLLPNPVTGARSVLTRPRSETLFAANPPWRASYLEAIEIIARLEPKEVGLLLEPGRFEYPIWVLLRERGLTPRLVHVGAAIEVPDPRGPAHPEVWLAIGPAAASERLDPPSDDAMRIRRFDEVAIFQRTGAADVLSR
jgi:hypothetical protein